MTADEARPVITEQSEAFMLVSRELPDMSADGAMIAALVAIGAHTLMTNLLLVEILAELESARHSR